jgi:sulfite exporter TauE/SafE
MAAAVFVALLLGFAGSLHCIGMCGPIALALPIGRYSGSKKVAAILLYNIGRITTYSLLGLLFGMIGQGFSCMGLQQVLSIILGSAIIAMVIAPQSLTASIEQKISSILVLNKVKRSIQILFGKGGMSSLFFIGMLNGLLPCGFVYVAIPMAMATGVSWQGAIFMGLFGVGTLPAMLMVSFSHSFFSVPFRGKVKKALPVFMGILGILLIVRGLNLGIAYLSPECDINGHVMHSCCKKH